MSDDYSSLETRIMSEFTSEPFSPDQQREYRELGRVMADQIFQQILPRQSFQTFSQLRDEVSQAVSVPTLPTPERFQTSRVAPAQNYPDTASSIPGLMQAFQRSLASHQTTVLPAGTVDYSRLRPSGPPIQNTITIPFASAEEEHFNQGIADIFRQSAELVNNRVTSGASSNYPTVRFSNSYFAGYDDRVKAMDMAQSYASGRPPGKSTTIACLQEMTHRLWSVGPSGVENWEYFLPDSQVTLDAAIGGFLDCVGLLRGAHHICTAKLSPLVMMEVRKEGDNLVAGKPAGEYSVYVIFRAPRTIERNDSRSWITQCRVSVRESDPLTLAYTIKELLQRFYEGVWREFLTVDRLVPQARTCGRCDRLEAWIQSISASESGTQAPPPDEPVQLSLF